MDRGKHVRRQIGLDRLSTLLRHAEGAAEQRLRGGRAQANEDVGPDELQLGVQPRAAGGDLGPVRLRVDPALAARAPLEVLHRVRQVDARPVDTGFRERLVEQPSCRADERPALAILAVARLLADEHQLRVFRPFAEHGLRPDLPERAGSAVGGCFPKRAGVCPALPSSTTPGRRAAFPRKGDSDRSRRCDVLQATVDDAFYCGKGPGFGSMSGTEHAANSAASSPVRLAAVDPPDALARAAGLVESYRGLADVFREVLSEQSLDALLERIADTVGALVPYDELVIYEADAAHRKLAAVLVRSKWAQEIVDDEASFGVGITGWAVENREPVHTNEAHLDPRVRIVQGTPVDPEALIVVPLVARGELKGALNIYRVGDDAEFDEDEFELAKRFGDAAALALDNAKSRARLEHQAQTDALTGLLNHRYFHERLRAELQRASRSHLPVGLLMLDIDDFKRVNDIHGHAAGDDVLVQLADSLRGKRPRVGRRVPDRRRGVRRDPAGDGFEQRLAARDSDAAADGRRRPSRAWAS